MSTFTRALELACQAHAGQTDKADAEYIRHPMAVAWMVKDDPEAEIVAILHDAFEDLKGTGMEKIEFREKVRVEFGQRIYDALLALTHRHGENYDDYIERVAANYLARKVKCADLTHNMDPRRIPSYQIVDKDFERWARYRKAMIRLQREL